MGVPLGPGVYCFVKSEAKCRFLDKAAVPSRTKEFVMARISLTVNGKSRSVDTDPSTPLLYVLRDDLELNGPRFGCGLAQCGACTVIMDGAAVRSCTLPVNAAKGKSVTTLEGLG